MNMIIRQAYDFFESRRGWLYAITLTLLGLCLAVFLSASIRADIRTMLPEGEDKSLARDFDMLAQSSLANNVFITIRATGDATREELLTAAESLSKQLTPPMFALIDPTSVKPLAVMNFLLDNAPNLMDSDDLKRVQGTLDAKTIKAKLSQAFRQLTSPQGLVFKSLTRRDPLDFKAILAPRLKSLNALSEATIEDGYVFNKDGNAILLTAKSDIPLTDADGSQRLLDQFEQAKASLPPGIKAELISGHVHTIANASTIKHDLVTISLVALVALALLFVIFFRSSQALGVFLAPLVAMCAALGGLALFAETISAIVIGFGAVLIGISIDFAMHVYFAIARHAGSPGQSARAAARPIFYCALTSCAAFGALFLSGIPGIRQLALFSIAGLIASALFSLLVLPHLCRVARIVRQPSKSSTSFKRHPKTGLIIWAVVMLGCLWFGTSVSIDPDLRNIGYMPEMLQQAEQRFSDTWGAMRDRAVIFAKGSNLDEALVKNENVSLALNTHFPDVQATSLAPIMPSLPTQATNRDGWSDFWTVKTRETAFHMIQKQGKELGFSQKAFIPFKKSLEAQPGPIMPPDLNEASLGLLTEMFMPNENTLVTFLPDSRELQAFFSPEKEQELGVRLISNSRFKSSLETAMNSDIKHFIILSGVAVMILAFILFRDARRASLALLPALTGVVMVFGVLGLTDTDLNLFHITALPLIIGLGADYGIFLVNQESQLFELNTTAAVKVSGLTTLAGFGVLILARHPSLHSLGITVLVGIGAALVCALYLMPHLLRRQP